MVEIVERPLRWDCKENGCYQERCAPRLEWFSDCFPGRISMGDVDGCVEINGKFLWFEWKSVGGKLQRSQEIMYQQLMNKGDDFTVFVVSGNSKTMEVNSYEVFHAGQRHYYEGNIDNLKAKITSWSEWAKK